MFRQHASTLVLLTALCIVSSMAQLARASEERGIRTWADALDIAIAPLYASDKHRTFDFWIGDWDVNWRSQSPGEFHYQPEGSWTRNRVFPILGGKAIMEVVWDRDKPDEASQRGMSVRYFDTEKARWVMAQHWPDPTGAGWAMLDQLIGDEHHGRISVYSTQMRSGDDGTLHLEHRRYNFSDIRPGMSFRWDGSNTADFGKTWNTWAISEMHRVGDVPAFDPAGTPLPDVVNELLCQTEPHGAFEFLQGVWTGQKQSGDVSTTATLTAGKALDGCSVVSVLEVEDTRTLMTFAYSDFFERWFSLQLDDRPGTGHTYLVSNDVAVGSTFEEARNLIIEDEFTRFVTEEKLDALDSKRRLVWESIGPNELGWREETRPASQSAWQLETRYRFRKAD